MSAIMSLEYHRMSQSIHLVSPISNGGISGTGVADKINVVLVKICYINYPFID